MGSRLYIAAIVLCWAMSMTWLVTERILPPFFRGEPPPTGLLRQTEPVGWRISVDGKPCGIAVLRTVDGGQGVAEAHSLVSLDRLARPRGGPPWLTALADTIVSLRIEIRTRSSFDPLGRLASFETRLELDEIETPVVVAGRVLGGKLRLRVRVGLLDRTIEHPWPADGLLASELMPESKLLSVYPGRRWRKEIYSPFAPPSHPIEVLEAQVVGERKINHNDEPTRVRCVEFRSEKAAGVLDDDRLRATMLVSEQGTVLQQEAYFLGSRLTFDRMTDLASQVLAKERLELDRHASTTTPSGPAETARLEPE